MEHKEKYTLRFKQSTNNMDCTLKESQFYKLENNLLLGNINHSIYIKRVFTTDCVEEQRFIEFDSIYSILFAIIESIKE